MGIVNCSFCSIAFNLKSKHQSSLLVISSELPFDIYRCEGCSKDPTFDAKVIWNGDRVVLNVNNTIFASGRPCVPFNKYRVSWTGSDDETIYTKKLPKSFYT